MKDCVIIGKGPAGLSAALYVRRAGYTPLVIGRDSGALGQSHRIENYFGLAEPVSGDELFRRGLVQVERLGIEVQKSWGLGSIVNAIFEEVAEHHLIQPTFLMAHSAEISPLARRNDENPEVTDRFELFIGGREIGNGFSELNDAEDQNERFDAQVAAKEDGDDEAMFKDEDFVVALEHGLPPTAGEGLGIDRLAMLYANAPSIRDVILFPAMRQK